MRDGKKYHVKITYLLATDSRREILGDVFLMSPHEYDTKKHYVWVMILRNNPSVADLSDVNNYYSCADRGNLSQSGEIYVNLMIKFLTEYQEKGFMSMTSDLSAMYQIGKKMTFFPIGDYV